MPAASAFTETVALTGDETIANENAGEVQVVAADDQRLKRLSLYLGFAKFMIGTVALGIVSLYLNDRIQQGQLDLAAEKSKHEMSLQDHKAEVNYLKAAPIGAAVGYFSVRA